MQLTIENNDTVDSGEAEWAEDVAENSYQPVLLMPCPWKCELTNDRGYVLYSALGSFYIPMFVMLFFYWRIYRAAVRTTKAINQGFKTTKGRIIICPRYFLHKTIQHYLFESQILVSVCVYCIVVVMIKYWLPFSVKT